MAEPETFVLAYDTDLRRPGCVLLQAVMGGDTIAFRRFFGDNDNWLLSKTPGLKLLRATAQQWEMVAEMRPRG